MRTTSAWIATFVMAAASLAGAGPNAHWTQAGQQASAATVRLAGQVVDDRTGRPIAGAAVTITGGPGLPDPPSIIANGTGRFTFDRLRPGRFVLTATAQGYLSGGDHSDDGMAPAELQVDASDGASKIDLVIRLVKPASLSGYVLDDSNAPVEGVQLGVFRETYVAGYRRLVVAGAASSDDRGWFQADRLAPGAYIVCGISERFTVPRTWQERLDRASSASPADRSTFQLSAMSALIMPSSGPAFVFGDVLVRPGSSSMGPFVTSDGRVWSAPNTCNGNTASPSAAPKIALASGDHQPGVDLRMELEPAMVVSGHVHGPAGPLAWQGLRLESEGLDALGWAEGAETATTISDGSGAFMFVGIPQGTYTLRAFSIPQLPMGASPSDLPSGDTLAAIQTIAVGSGGIKDLAVRLSRGPRVSGRIVFRGTGEPPQESEVVKAGIIFGLADGAAFRLRGAAPRVVVAADGAFTSTGLVPGRYVLQATPLGRWQIETAMLNGIDISDQPFDAGDADLAGVVITMTDQVSRVSGTVRDDKGLPVRGGRVVLFPADRSRWIGQGLTPRRQRVADTSSTGVYAMTGLPPGEYFVAALGPGDASDPQSPATLARLAAIAQKITLTPVEARTLDLRAEGRR